MSAIFQTTIGRQHSGVRDKVVDFTIENLIRRSDNILKIEGFKGLYKISPDVPVTIIPPFMHPIAVEFREDTVMVLDTRAFELPGGKVRNARELPLIHQRGLLALVWENERQSYMPIMATLASIYSEWMIQAIRSRFGVDIREQEIIRIVLAGYYRIQYFSSEELKGMDVADLRNIIMKQAVRELRIAQGFVDEVLSSPEMNEALDKVVSEGDSDANIFLTALNFILNNPSVRLDATALLMLTINSSWMGYASKDLAGAATEYPPYLAYMAHQALTVGIFRKTKIGAAVESTKRMRIRVENISSWITETETDYRG